MRKTRGMGISRDLDWLAIVRRATGVAALVVAGASALNVASNFLIIEPVLLALGADGIHLALQTVWWLQVAASLVVLVGLIAGWRLDRPVWARGVTPVALGMVVLWGWWLLNRYVDLWGWSSLSPEQVEHSADDPELLRLSYLSVFTWVAVEIVAIVLLVVGAVRLLRPARTAAVVASTP